MAFFSEPIDSNVGKRNNEKINAVQKDQGKSEGMIDWQYGEVASYLLFKKEWNVVEILFSSSHAPDVTFG